MGVQWIGDQPSELRAWLKAQGDQASRAAVKVVAEVVAIGANDVQQIITDSHTETGRKRAAAGKGEPGRVQNGDMRKMVSHRTQAVGQSEIVGEYGWLDGDVADYYEHQEEGTKHISPMRALFSSFNSLTPVLKEKLQQRGFEIS